MKPILAPGGIVLLAALALAAWFVACASAPHTRWLGEALDPVYETASDIRAMSPCRAKVIERGPCYICLRKADGQRFYLGSPGSPPEVWRFLDVLREGPAYRFPETFLKYEEQHRDSSTP